MAPPIPGHRRPVPAARRSGGDVVAGLLAILALTVLIAGVPVALITVLGLPIPHSKPTVGLLTHQLSTLSIIRILSVIVWLAWLQLVICVFAEIRAAVRTAGVPARIPLAGGTQAIAHRLVTAALLLFSATSALSPAYARAAAAPRTAHTISAIVKPGSQVPAAAAGPEAVAARAARAAAAAPAHPHAPHAEKIYIVKPPVGRYHESLWEIAQNHLGNGLRYREIFEMNKDHPQPDGTMLTMASLIRPGWVLRMPRDAYGPGVEIVSRGTPGGPAGAAEAAAARQAIRASQAAAGAPPPAAPSGTTRAPAAAGQPGGGLLAFPHELSAASLLAAGLLAALGRRRREQLWRRTFGRRIVTPDGDAAIAEEALRLGADEPSVLLLDTGLRCLSRELAAEGKPPPTVFAAHIGEASLDLWIGPADENPPHPWQPVDDGQVWRLPVDAVAGLDPDQAGAALAPYPGLVSIGTTDTGRMLVDLEVAHGLIAVRGPRHMVQAVLAAMAVELAASRWADRMDVTLVGFGPELASLFPERLRAARTLDDAMPVLEARAAEIEHSLATLQAHSVLTGRSAAPHPDTWAPHYLIMAVPPVPGQRERLLALAGARHRTAMGYVVAGDVPGAAWTWDVSEHGVLHAGELGFDLAAQLLPVQQYRAVVGLFGAARQEDGVPLGDPRPGAAPPEQLTAEALVAAEVRLLGQVAVQAPGPIEPDRVGAGTEIVAFLASHPGGVHPNVLAAAIWPRGVTPDVVEAALSRVRAWLGTDSAGRFNLVTDPGGRLGLGPEVRVDWQVFRALVAQAVRAGQAAEYADEAACLTRALELVQGQLLDGRGAGRYAWLAADPLEYEAAARVADAGHRLAEMRLAAGDAQGAMEAVRAALRLAFSDELLWRDLLIAAHATGQEHVLRAVVGEVSARVSLDEVLPAMAPETEALIDELLPSWRSSVA